VGNPEVEMIVKSARENGVLFKEATEVEADIFYKKGTLHLRRLNAVVLI